MILFCICIQNITLCNSKNSLRQYFDVVSLVIYGKVSDNAYQTVIKLISFSKM